MLVSPLIGTGRLTPTKFTGSLDFSVGANPSKAAQTLSAFTHFVLAQTAYNEGENEMGDRVSCPTWHRAHLLADLQGSIQVRWLPPSNSWQAYKARILATLLGHSFGGWSTHNCTPITRE
jgi:hypothetical protein